MTRIVLRLACLASLSLAACGAPKPKADGTAAVGVFISAQDCAASQKLQLDDCSQLIQKALDAHQQGQKTYTSQRLCAAVEGPDQCERADNNAFQRRLLAFKVVFSTPPSSAPLYSVGEKGVVGFATLDKKQLLAVDETLIFSADAKFVAEGNSGS
jgi:uncharacterized protein YgiB involved in biofilm formation